MFKLNFVGMKLFSFLLVFIIPNIMIGQNGYYVTDSSAVYGLKIYNGLEKDNSKVCRAIRQNDTLSLSPYDITEYGTSGKTYVSKTISINGKEQRVFLEQMVKGKISLFYYNGNDGRVFLINKDSSGLINLPKYDKITKSNYKEILSNYIGDCEYTRENLKLVNYAKQPLKQLIENHNECIFKPFRFTKYGLEFGYEINKLQPAFTHSSDYIEKFDIGYQKLLLFGVFIDKPILSTKLSYHLSIYYSQINNSYKETYENIDYENIDLDFKYKSKSLSVPLLLRYSLPYNKLHPFINGGPIIRYDFKNEGKILLSSGVQKDIVAKTPNQSFAIGFSAGIGLDIKLIQTNSLSLEIRYTDLRAIGENSGESIFLNRSGLQFLSGISF